MFLIDFAASTGNITTISGDLLLDPASRNIMVNAVLLPSSTATKDLGNSSYSWRNIYAYGYYSPTSSVSFLPLNSAGGVQYVDYISIPANAIDMRITPEGNFSRSVALLAYPKGWADGMYFAAGSNIMGKFLPITNNAYDIGSSTNVWKTIYGRDLQGFTTVYARTSGSGSNVFIDSSGNFYRSISSKRYKENIRLLTNLETNWIYKLQPILYDTKDGQMKGRNGFIAEDVAQINPQVVHYAKDESGTLVADSVEYDRIIVGLVKQVQYLREELCKKDNTYGFCTEPQNVQYVQQPMDN